MKIIKRISVFVFIIIAAMMMSAAAGAETTVTDFEGLKKAVQAGGSIVLGGNITVTETITVPGNTYVGISGAHTLTLEAGLNIPMFNLTAGGMTSQSGNYYLSTGSHLYLNGVTLAGAGSTGTLVDVGKNALLNLENATIQGADVAVDVAVGDPEQQDTPDGGTVYAFGKVVIEGKTAGVKIGGLTRDGAHILRNKTIYWKSATADKNEYVQAVPNLISVFGSDKEGTSIGFTVKNVDRFKKKVDFFGRSTGTGWKVGEARKCLIPDEEGDKERPILRTEGIYNITNEKYPTSFLAFAERGSNGNFIVYGNNHRDYQTNSFSVALTAATGTWPANDIGDEKVICQDFNSKDPTYLVMNADATWFGDGSALVSKGKVQVVSSKPATLTLNKELSVGSAANGTEGELTLGGSVAALGIKDSVVNVEGTTTATACVEKGTLTLNGGALTGHKIRVLDGPTGATTLQTRLNLNKASVGQVEVANVYAEVYINGGSISELNMPGQSPQGTYSDVYIQGDVEIGKIYLPYSNYSNDSKGKAIKLNGNANLKATVTYKQDWIDYLLVLNPEGQYQFTGDITVDPNAADNAPYWCVEMNNNRCYLKKVRVRAGATGGNDFKSYASLDDAWKAAVAAGGNYTFNIAPDVDGEDSSYKDIAKLTQTLTVPAGLHYTLCAKKYTFGGDGKVREEDLAPDVTRLLKKGSSFTGEYMIDASQGDLTLIDVAMVEDKALKLGGTLTLSKKGFVQQALLTGDKARVKQADDFKAYPGDNNPIPTMLFIIPAEGLGENITRIDSFISANNRTYEDKRKFSVKGLGKDVWSLEWATDGKSASLVKQAGVASVQKYSDPPVFYTSFDKAVEAVAEINDDVTIRLYDNVEITATMELKTRGSSDKIKIMAVGKDITISRGPSFTLDLFEAISDLTLDAEEGYTLTLDGKNVANYYHLVTSYRLAKINITERVTLKNNNSTISALKMYNGEMAGTITGNTGGGVTVNYDSGAGSDPVLLSGKITNNEGGTCGGVEVYRINTLISGTVSGNRATGTTGAGAGGVYVSAAGNATITGSVTGNTSTLPDGAGGVYAAKSTDKTCGMVNIAGDVNITGNTMGANPSNLRGKAIATAAITDQASVGFSMVSQEEPTLLTYAAGLIKEEEDVTSGRLFADVPGDTYELRWTEKALFLAPKSNGVTVSGIDSLVGQTYRTVKDAQVAAVAVLGKEDTTTPFTVWLNAGTCSEEVSSAWFNQPNMTINLNGATWTLSSAYISTISCGAVIGPGNIVVPRIYNTSSASFTEDVTLNGSREAFSVLVTNKAEEKRYYVSQISAFAGVQSGETVEILPDSASITTTTPLPAGVTLNIPSGKTLTLGNNNYTANGTISGEGTLALGSRELNLGTTGQLGEGLTITASAATGRVKVAAGNTNTLPSLPTLPFSRANEMGDKFYFTSLEHAKAASGMPAVLTLEADYTITDATMCDWNTTSAKPVVLSFDIKLNGHVLTIPDKIEGKTQAPFMYVGGTVDLGNGGKIVNNGVFRARKYVGATQANLTGTGLYSEDMKNGGDVLAGVFTEAVAEIYSSNKYGNGTRFFAKDTQGAINALTAQKSTDVGTNDWPVLKLLGDMSWPEGIELNIYHTVNLNGKTLTIPAGVTYANKRWTTLSFAAGGTFENNGTVSANLGLDKEGTPNVTGDGTFLQPFDTRMWGYDKKYYEWSVAVAKAQAGENGKQVALAAEYTIASGETFTIPAGVTLGVTSNGKMTVASGGTLVVDGGLDCVGYSSRLSVVEGGTVTGTGWTDMKVESIKEKYVAETSSPYSYFLSVAAIAPRLNEVLKNSSMLSLTLNAPATLTDTIVVPQYKTLSLLGDTLVAPEGKTGIQVEQGGSLELWRPVQGNGEGSKAIDCNGTVRIPKSNGVYAEVTDIWLGTMGKVKGMDTYDGAVPAEPLILAKLHLINPADYKVGKPVMTKCGSCYPDNEKRYQMDIAKFTIDADGRLQKTGEAEAVTITAVEDQAVTTQAYTGQTIDVSKLFTFEPFYAASGATYTLDPATETGTLKGSNLTVTKTGEFTITANITKDDVNYTNDATATNTLTVTKGTQAAPDAPTMASRTASSVTLASVNGMDYSKDGTTWQAEALFGELQPATEYTFYARRAETDLLDSSPASTGATFVTLAAPPDEKSYAIDYKAETLTLVGDGLELSLTEGFEVKKESPFTLTPGAQPYDVYIRKAATDSVPASGALTVTIAARPAAPTAVAEDAIGRTGKGKITGVTEAMEYKKEGDAVYAAVAGTEIANLGTGKYLVRVKATTSAFYGLDQALTIARKAVTPTKDSYVIDYEGETLTFNDPYEVSAANPFGDVVTSPCELTPGTDMYIREKADATIELPASDVLTIPVAARPATPTAAAEDAIGPNGKGKITGVTEAMEYRLGEGEYAPVSGATIENLEPGNYFVRVKATETAFASEEQTLTIQRKAKPPVAGEGFTLGYVEELLTITEGYAASWTEDFAEAATGVVPGGTLYVRSVLENGDTSAPFANPIPARPATPTATVVNMVGDKNGAINGVNNAMEYKKQGGAYQPVSGDSIEITEPGTYLVRVKATETSFASEEQTLTIGKCALSLTAPIFAGVNYGYTQPAAQGVTVTNTGDAEANVTEASLSGDQFTLVGGAATVAAGQTDNTTWTLQPKANLGAGTYTGTLTLTYAGGATATCEVSFTVNKIAPTKDLLVYTAPGHLVANGDAKAAKIEAKPDVVGLGKITVIYSPANPVEPGTYTVTADVSEGDNYLEATGIGDSAWTFTITQQKAVTGIEIAHEPKLDYLTDGTYTEPLDLSDLVVRLNYNDATSADVAYADFGSEITAQKNGQDKIVVTAHGFTAETDAITVTQAVAKVTNENILFGSLADAAAAKKDITLLQIISLTTEVTFDGTITLDLNEKMITTRAPLVILGSVTVEGGTIAGISPVIVSKSVNTLYLNGVQVIGSVLNEKGRTVIQALPANGTLDIVMTDPKDSIELGAGVDMSGITVKTGTSLANATPGVAATTGNTLYFSAEKALADAPDGAKVVLDEKASITGAVTVSGNITVDTSNAPADLVKGGGEVKGSKVTYETTTESGLHAAAGAANAGDAVKVTGDITLTEPVDIKGDLKVEGNGTLDASGQELAVGGEVSGTVSGEVSYLIARGAHGNGEIHLYKGEDGTDLWAANGKHTAKDGDTLRVVAVPKSGYRFEKFEGALIGANGAFTVDKAGATIGARFALIPPPTPMPAPEQTPTPAPTPTPTPEPVKATGVTLDKLELALEAGESAALSATVEPEDATNKQVEWASSDEEIATVQGGVVTGIAKGTAQITVTTQDGGFTAQCQVTVTEPEEPEDEPTADMDVLAIRKGKTFELSRLVSGYEGEWTIDNPKVATFGKGRTRVKGQRTGKATLTFTITKAKRGAKYLNKSVAAGDKIEVKLYVVSEQYEVSKLKVSPASLCLTPGETKEMEAVVSPKKAKYRQVFWSSSDEKVFTVNREGKVTAKGPGKAVLTATATSGHTRKIAVTVSDEIVKLTLNATKKTLKKGKTFELSLKSHLPQALSAPELTWKSSKEGVATVDGAGLVTAIKKGKATITATAPNGVKVSCKITVK